MNGGRLILGVIILSLGFCLTDAHAQEIAEFAMPPGTAIPSSIVAGPDGKLWFAASSGLGTVTTSGVVQGIPIPGNVGTGAGSLAFDFEGTLWFTEGVKIGRWPLGGLLVEYTLPLGHRAFGIAAGPDGNIWFTEPANGLIGRITPTGSLVEFPVPGGPYAITAGPDGNLWFTEAGNRIGRITTSGTVTEFGVVDNPYSAGDGITADPDGAIWFTQSGKIGRITASGVISEFEINRWQGQRLGGITVGPDGNIWFTEGSAPVGGRGSLPAVPPSKIGRITREGVITEFLLPTSWAYPVGIAAGPDGNLWVAELYVSKIARVPTSLPDPCTRCIKTINFR